MASHVSVSVLGLRGHRISSRIEFAKKPCSRHRPVPGDRSPRHIQQLSDFALLETAEKAEFDDSSLPFTEFLQSLQSIIKVKQFESEILAAKTAKFEIHWLHVAASLLRLRSSRVVDQDTTNRSGRGREEVGPILPADRRVANHSQIRFMDEFRRIPASRIVLCRQRSLCDLAKLLIDQRRQLFNRFAVARREALQELGDFGHGNGFRKLRGYP